MTMKALASPKALKIHKKGDKWVMNPAPGPHGIDESVPMGVLLRTYLGLAENRKESRYLLRNNEVLVDGRRVKDENFPVGLLDVVDIPKADKGYIILVDGNARLYPKEAGKKQAGFKLCKLAGKTMTNGGKLQLNLYDGKNLAASVKESKKYKTGGTLVLELPGLKIRDFIERAKGKAALVAKGRHAGKIGRITDITESGLHMKSLSTLDCDGEKVVTNTDYIFVVGDKEPMI